MVLLDVCICTFDQQNTLSEVRLDPIVANVDTGTVRSAHASPSVLAQRAILIDSGPVLSA